MQTRKTCMVQNIKDIHKISEAMGVHQVAIFNIEELDLKKWKKKCICEIVYYTFHLLS